MSLGISNILTPERKNELRKVGFMKKTKLPDRVKAEVYAGCTSAGAAMQFQRDLWLYGLYEALLYVENGERQGLYKPETAIKAVNAYFDTKKKAVDDFDEREAEE